MSGIDLAAIKTWRQRVAHLDRPTDFAERSAAIEEAAELRRAIASLAAAPAQPAEVALTAEDVQWIVNDIAELGVMVRGQAFFLYKGTSLVYREGSHDDGAPMMFRPVFKREFGECCHPVNYRDLTKIGTVSPDDSDEWKPLPAAPQAQQVAPTARLLDATPDDELGGND